MRADGINAHVVEHLLMPVVAALEVSHGDPVRLLREVRDTAVLVSHPGHVLDVIANRIKYVRKKIVSAKCFTDEIDEAIKICRKWELNPHSGSWAAWLDYYRVNQPYLAKILRKARTHGGLH